MARVWAADDDMAVGVLKAIEQAKRNDIKIVFGGAGAKGMIETLIDGSDPHLHNGLMTIRCTASLQGRRQRRCRDSQAPPNRDSSLKFRQRLASATLDLGVIFLYVRHCQSLGNQSTRVGGFPHLCVGLPQLNIVHEALWIDLDSFLKA